MDSLFGCSRLALGLAALPMLALAGDFDFDTEGGKYTYEYPYYVIDVGTASNRLAAATTIVKVTNAGDAGTTVGYSDFFQAKTGTFVKKGAGWLVIDEPITNFTGRIHLMEGYLLSRCYGSLGKEVMETRNSESRAARSAGLYVHNGATVVRFNTKADAANDVKWDGKNTDRSYIALEGSGVDGNGALIGYAPGTENSWNLGFDTEFLGDATIVGMQDTALKMSWSPKPGSRFWLNGHKLTIRGAASSSVFLFNWGKMSAGEICATNIQWSNYGTYPELAGGATNVLTLGEGAKLVFTGTTSGDLLKWTLVADGAKYMMAYGSPADSINTYNWAGPVNLKRDLPLYNNSPQASCLTLNNYVYGPGGLPVYAAPSWNNGTKLLNFHLVCPTNAFRGAVGLNKGGMLHLHADGALPADSAGAYLTNSALRLYSTAHALPQVTFDGTGTVSALVNSSTNYISQALTKTGTGALVLDAPLSSDTLTIRGGGVKVSPPICAGFIEGQLPGHPVNGASSVWSGTRNLGTNAVVLSANLPNVGWSKCTCLTYAGYLWNREATNVNWTFVTYAGNGGYLFFDDENRSHLSKYAFCGDYYSNMSTASWHTVTATPGPHYFEARYYSSVGGNAGPGGSNVTHLGDPSRSGTTTKVTKAWPQGKGLVWDPLGRAEANPDCFQTIADPGDGSVVTYTTNFVEETVRLLPRYRKIVGAPGAWLELPGVNFSIKELDGFLAVSNCPVFTVEEKWTASADAIAAGGTLQASNLVFAAQVPFQVTDLTTLPIGSYTVAEAAEPIATMPVFDRSDKESVRKWHLIMSEDGRKLKFEYVNGTMIMLR